MKVLPIEAHNKGGLQRKAKTKSVAPAQTVGYEVGRAERAIHAGAEGENQERPVVFAGRTADSRRLIAPKKKLHPENPRVLEQVPRNLLF